MLVSSRVRSAPLPYPRYRKATDAGNASAMNNLGICHEDGLGVSTSREVAARLYHEAAALGNVHAQSNLAYLYAGQQQWSEASRWFRRAAQEGSADAMYNLGKLYEAGLGASSLAGGGGGVGRGRRARPAGRARGAGRGRALTSWWAPGRAPGRGVAGAGEPQSLRQAAYYYTLAQDLGQSNARTALTRVTRLEAEAKAAAHRAEIERSALAQRCARGGPPWDDGHEAGRCPRRPCGGCASASPW